MEIAMNNSTLEAYWGLPQEVKFCRRCVMSNQRPSSYPEFRHTEDRKVGSLHIQEDGICDACHAYENKEHIDWQEREKELLELLAKYRRNDGRYDCVVPGSGGKDSVFAAWLLKYKYDMHPLTVTWPPLMYTDYGWQNYLNWIEIGGFDNILVKPNGKVHRLLTKFAIENLLHPFQTFILGQKNVAPRIALQYDIPLIFFGEHEAEVGGNPITDTYTPLRDPSFFAMENLDNIYLGGVSVRALIEEHNLSLADLYNYLPLSYDELDKSNIMCYYLGYYIKWIPQEAYYFAVEKTNFQARPHRTEGTYSKYASIDDKIDDLHYYTTHVKFGIGRATSDASQEIRNHHLTREEAVALVERFDGEKPKRYVQEVMDYLGMDIDHFWELCDSEKFRSPHLWKKENGLWKLRHAVFYPEDQPK
jgi:N-acetyl sugar amidotransferase